MIYRSLAEPRWAWQLEPKNVGICGMCYFIQLQSNGMCTMHTCICSKGAQNSFQCTSKFWTLLLLLIFLAILGTLKWRIIKAKQKSIKWTALKSYIYSVAWSFVMLVSSSDGKSLIKDNSSNDRAIGYKRSEWPVKWRLLVNTFIGLSVSRLFSNAAAAAVAAKK